MLKAIETKYKGYKFRSRLEARWARFFDALDIEWEYEKEGYELPSGWYLPDFWLPEFGTFAEVKPCQFTEEEFLKCFQLANASSCGVLFLNSTPDNSTYVLIAPAVQDENGCNFAFASVGFHKKKYSLAKKQNTYASRYETRSWQCDQLQPHDLNVSAMFSKAFMRSHFLASKAVEAARSARFEHGEQG